MPCRLCNYPKQRPPKHQGLGPSRPRDPWVEEGASFQVQGAWGREGPVSGTLGPVACPSPQQSKTGWVFRGSSMKTENIISFCVPGSL